MDTARDWYADHGMPFPPVPPDLERDLRPLGNGMWATRSAAATIWETKALAEDAARAYPAPQAAIGSAGRGLASNALYCNVVTEHVAVFVEHGVGNVGDSDDVVTAIHVDYTMLDRIIDRAAHHAGPPIVVLYSTLRLHAAVFHEGEWTEHRTFQLLHHVLDLLG